MFAVIKTGGKQYRVAADDTITVMHLAGEPGSEIVFDNVLMIGDGANATVGTPVVSGASVAGEIVDLRIQAGDAVSAGAVMMVIK